MIVSFSIDDFAVLDEGVTAVVVADDPAAFDACLHRRQLTLIPAGFTSSLLILISSAHELVEFRRGHRHRIGAERLGSLPAAGS